MLSLPRELIILILNHIEQREYISEDGISDLEEDDEDCQQMKRLYQENNGDGHYYPGRNLYATCSSFVWLKELEYICIESGEFYYNIISRNVNGTAHGMCYNGTTRTGILGYSCYNNGISIKENIFSTGVCGRYRYIDDVEYQDDCERACGTCYENCHNCQQLNIIQQQVFIIDPQIKDIFDVYYDEWKVFVRQPLTTDIISQLHYNSDHLKKAH